MQSMRGNEFFCGKFSTDSSAGNFFAGYICKSPGIKTPMKNEHIGSLRISRYNRGEIIIVSQSAYHAREFCAASVFR